MKFIFLWIGIFFSLPFSPAWAVEEKQMESLVNELVQGKPLELKALEIRAKIHEPMVLYILDRRKTEVNFMEDEIQLSPRILDSIQENQLP